MYRLLQEGYLEDKTNFGKSELIYVIQKTNEKDLSAFFNDNVICVQMPADMIKELDSTDQVGFSGMQGDLFLLVEKDFTCLDGAEEDQDDNYPNPLAKNCNE
jgi:hypothetical protein